MKILVLTPRYPWPITGGDVLRIFNVCKTLKSQGHTLHLLSFYTDEDVIENKELNDVFDKIFLVKINEKIAKVKALLYFLTPFASQIGYYYSQNFSKKFKEIENNYDNFLVHLIRMMPYIKKSKLNKVIFEMTDSISLNYKRSLKYRKNIKKMFYYVEMKKLKVIEKFYIQRAKKTIVVSEVDKNCYSTFLQKKIFVQTNGYESKKINMFQIKNKDIVFIGNMRTDANHKMVIYFIKEILPEIRKNNLNIKLKIIGAEPQTELFKICKNQNIEITGKVNNIFDHLNSAAISVCPMLFGAGVQNKIIESASFGIPVVTTEIGSEGLLTGILDSLVIAKNKNDFIKKINYLIKNDELRNKLSNSGYNFVIENYSWNKTLENYLL